VLVGELAVAWLEWASREYRKDGAHTSEYPLCALAVKHLADYADVPAAAFTPGMLRAVREVWVSQGLARKTVNGYAKRIVRMFKWGVGRQLVASTTADALKAVETLKAGRSLAKDRAPRKPVSAADVAAVLPHLPPVVASMVQLQRLAGMRPGEVCKLRPGDLDATADVWRYVVPGNKNQHRGKSQAYYFGPKAIATLTPHLDGVAADARVFPMARQRYWKAVRKACTGAGVPPWTPHQLRHSFATEVAGAFRSLDHAAAAIGDTAAVAQAVYVHLDPRERAKIEVAKAMG
jgi:integrase